MRRFGHRRYREPYSVGIDEIMNGVGIANQSLTRLRNVSVARVCFGADAVDVSVAIPRQYAAGRRRDESRSSFAGHISEAVVVRRRESDTAVDPLVDADRLFDGSGRMVAGRRRRGDATLPPVGAAGRPLRVPPQATGIVRPHRRRSLQWTHRQRQTTSGRWTQRCRPSEPLGGRCEYRHNRRELYNRSAAVLFSGHTGNVKRLPVGGGGII